jgi:hypothetical protein
VRARERLDRPRVLERDVIERVVGDVLADALLAAALDPDRRRDAGEGGRRLELLAGELVALDLEWQVGETIERAQCFTFALPRR